VELHRARADVVEDRVAEDVVERVLSATFFAREPITTPNSTS
jgi:hypothetical protein